MFPSKGNSDEFLGGYQRAADLIRQNRFAEAREVCEGILKIDPRQAKAYKILAALESHQQNIDLALLHLRKAAEVEPGLAENWTALGEVSFLSRQFEAGKTAFEKALKLDPANPEALLWLGMIEFGSGNQEKAQANFKKVIQNRPERGQPYYLLTKIRNFDPSPDFIRALEGVITKHKNHGTDAVFAHYALAVADKKKGDLQGYKTRIKAANKMQSGEGGRVDQELERIVVTNQKEFSKGLLDFEATLSDPTPVPIFLVGLPRSGSTLVEQILAGTKEVKAGDEMFFVHSHLVRPFSEKTKSPYPSGVKILSRKDWSTLGENYLQRIQLFSQGKPFVSDKLLTNLFNVGLIRMALPHAKILFVQRNLLDTGLSIFENYFEDRFAHFCDLEKMGQHFRLAYSMMDVWKNLFPGFIYDVSYEGLINAPEKVSREILEFCGLKWTPACLDFSRTKRPVFSTSFSQVKDELYASSIGKWKPFSDLLEPLKDEISDLIDDEGFLKR